MIGLLILVVALVFGGSAFAGETWTSFSIRPAKDGTSPFDYQLAAGISQRDQHLEFEWERQNGRSYQNQDHRLSWGLRGWNLGLHYRDAQDRNLFAAGVSGTRRVRPWAEVGVSMESVRRDYSGARVCGVVAAYPSWRSLSANARLTAAARYQHRSLSVSIGKLPLWGKLGLRPFGRYEFLRADGIEKRDYQGKVALVWAW